MAKDSNDLDTSKPATIEQIVQLLGAATGLQNEALVRAFSEAMRSNAPKRKITIGEYDPRSPWHPKKANSVVLTRLCFQNGFALNPDQLSNNEITLLNKIDRSGRYIERLVEVILRDDSAEDVVEIRYRNKTADQRNDIARHCRSLEDMLTQIVRDQEAAEAELIAMGRPPTKKRRPYFEAPSAEVAP